MSRTVEELRAERNEIHKELCELSLEEKNELTVRRAQMLERELDSNSIAIWEAMRGLNQ